MTTLPNVLLAKIKSLVDSKLPDAIIETYGEINKRMRIEVERGFGANVQLCVHFEEVGSRTLTKCDIVWSSTTRNTTTALACVALYRDAVELAATIETLSRK